MYNEDDAYEHEELLKQWYDHRPGLARRDRRLVTLRIAAVTGQRDPLRNAAVPLDLGSVRIRSRKRAADVRLTPSESRS